MMIMPPALVFPDRHGSLAAIDALVSAPLSAKLELTNKRELTPLGEAIATGNVDAATRLLDAGASAAAQPRGYTLLHLAAGLGQAGSVALLLQHDAAAAAAAGGGHLSAQAAANAEGATPLHAAALGNSVQCARLLLDGGAAADVRDVAGRTAADLVLPPAADSNKLGHLDPGAKDASRQLRELLRASGGLEQQAAAVKGATITSSSSDVAPATTNTEPYAGTTYLRPY